MPKWNKCLLKEMLQNAKRGEHSESLQKMDFLFIDNICEMLPVTPLPSSLGHAPPISFEKPPPCSATGSPYFLWETSSMLSHVILVSLEPPSTCGSTWAWANQDSWPLGYSNWPVKQKGVRSHHWILLTKKILLFLCKHQCKRPSLSTCRECLILMLKPGATFLKTF